MHRIAASASIFIKFGISIESQLLDFSSLTFDTGCWGDSPVDSFLLGGGPSEAATAADVLGGVGGTLTATGVVLSVSLLTNSTLIGPEWLFRCI